MKWIQLLVNQRPDLVDPAICALTGAGGVDWVSPLNADDYAEYRDRSAFDVLGLPETIPLDDFWPRRGPQWDALATLDTRGVVLVEAKAHIDELFSNGTGASGESLNRIVASLEETQNFLDVEPEIAWEGLLYQTCNRLAHLYFLRERSGTPAWLVNCYFVGDSDMRGPSSEAEWRAALKVTRRMLGLPDRHKLSRYCIDAFVDVADLSG